MASDTTTGWNFNRYNYANNNPYRYTDPDGRVGTAFFLNALEPVLHGEAVYQRYKQGDISAQQAISGMQTLGATANVETIRNELRSDKASLELARRRGVARAGAQERELVVQTGSGTRDWTRTEIQVLLSNGSVADYNATSSRG